MCMSELISYFTERAARYPNEICKIVRVESVEAFGNVVGRRARRLESLLTKLAITCRWIRCSKCSDSLFQFP